MSRNRILAVAAVIALAISVSGCSCGDNPPANDGGLNDAGQTDGGPDGGKVDSGIPPLGTDGGTDGGPGSICLATGTTCTADGKGGVCCSGICGVDGHCTEPTYCKGPTESCSSGPECCSNACVNGTCSSQTCADVSQACSSDSQCCTGICGSTGTCQSLPGQTCGVRGQACSSGADCCSTNCQGGVCVPAYSCQANGDICYGNAQCCGNACSANDGGPGTCLAITGGGGGGCTQDGNPCEGGSNCCTRICLDPGSGATVCQSAGGCRLTGDSCENNSQCCGGGLNPNGSVTCEIDQATGSGRCTQGQSCNPEGNICGAPVLPDGGSINAPQDCCDGQKAVCKLDSSGIPRCYGGGSTDCPAGYDGTAGCCIDQGQSCQFSDQCCGGVPCVPNPDADAGGFVCATANTCLGLGENCRLADGGPDTTACCAGSVCGTAGELGFACQLAQPPSDGGTRDGGTGDGGTTDAGACSANGAACASAATCCSGICGTGGDGGLQCLAPQACQVQDQSCTATSDCCSGLSCNVDPATSSGTCQPATCPGAGQTCSPTTPCCNGLACLDGAYANCDGTSPCTCTVIIN